MINEKKERVKELDLQPGTGSEHWRAHAIHAMMTGKSTVANITQMTGRMTKNAGQH